jgi:multisubunit Na+/H+ antiporter MnhB subunit
MSGPGPVDLEWHEQIARRIEASRNRPLRIRDLVGAVVVSAVVLGLGRSAVRSFGESGGVPLSTFEAWLAASAGVGVATILGVVWSLGIGRISTSLYRWGKARSGMIGPMALSAAVLADLVAFGTLMAIALGVTLYLVLSVLMLCGAFS